MNPFIKLALMSILGRPMAFKDNVVQRAGSQMEIVNDIIQQQKNQQGDLQTFFEIEGSATEKHEDIASFIPNLDD